MLNNIESLNIIELLFSHLNEKIKLKSIKYNKKIQNKIGIKLIDYKFLSGNYIIYETNNKGKNMMVIVMIYFLKVNI